jgi:hypothetical protein
MLSLDRPYSEISRAFSILEYWRSSIQKNTTVMYWVDLVQGIEDSDLPDNFEELEDEDRDEK